MKRAVCINIFVLSVLTGAISCGEKEPVSPQVVGNIAPAPAAFDGQKRSGLTYQLLIYSFADSDGDGIGDFNGITSRLDYLDALGVTAIWLSPAHPSSSYHGYDVNDYASLNPGFGTEDDFRLLVSTAHSKGIAVYMDYVLNHSGSDNEWFQKAKGPGNSPYMDYYVTSSNPDYDVSAGLIHNYGGASSPGMGAWHALKGFSGRLHFMLDWNAGTVTATVVPDDPTPSDDSSGKWIYYGNGLTYGLTETSSGIFEGILDIDTDWGFLVRTSLSTWDGGTKYGGRSGASTLTFGVPFQLDNTTASDIVLGQTTWYFASFDKSMPDFDYGPYATASGSPVFKALALTADKWIGMGVDGFRLDAVAWIYQNNTGEANPAFLRQWYDRCNTTWHDSGRDGDIFMVGEAWLSHSQEKKYYEGINSCFEFGYWGALKSALTGRNGSGFASTVAGYIDDHKAVRSDAITSVFMTNHDQNRAASDLGRDIALEKQAAAMLLTGGGKPFIYQGEELGYWGTKDRGDEYVRTPVLWDRAAKQCASASLGGKVDKSMLTADMSVEAQEADATSLLNVYKTFARLRNTYPSLASGTMSPVTGLGDNSFAAWYMSEGDERMFVIHNLASSARTVSVSATLDNPVALLGSGWINDGKLTLEANSSAVFLQ